MSNHDALSPGARRLIDELHEQGRRLKVAVQLPPEGPVSIDKVREVQRNFEDYLFESKHTVRQAAQRLGKSPGTLSTWRNFEGERDAFKGDLDGITRDVNAMVEVWAQQFFAPRGSDWIETDVARRMIATIKQTVRLRAMGMITSDSGRGKTMTFKAAQAKYPASVYVRIRNGSHTATGLAREIARQLRIEGARTTLQIQQAVEDTLTGSGRLFMIDELHGAKRDAVELLRDLHDVTECPIVVGGTRRLRDAVNDNEMWFGQLASRIAIQYDVNDEVRGKDGTPTRPLHSIDEIKRLFSSDEIRFTSGGLRELGRLANVEGYGGLRLCKQVVFIAATVCQGNKIDAELIRRVLRDLHGQLRVAHEIEPAMRRQEVKVA